MTDNTKKIALCNYDVALQRTSNRKIRCIPFSNHLTIANRNNCFESRVTQRIVNIVRYCTRLDDVVRVEETLNKILLLAIGQWPYQSSRTSHAIVIVIVTIVCTQIFAKLCGMFSYIHDMDIVIECLVPLMVDVSGMTKIMNSVLYVNEIRALLDQIKDDFYSLKNSNDIKMLEKYADSGKKSSTIYICVMYILTVAFLLMPLQPLILQVTNVTRPMLHRVEYYIDMDKYYFHILIHGYFTAIICVTSIVATDAIFVIFMRHACGLFIITGSRIEQAIQEIYLIGDVNLPITKDTAYRNMVQCVHDHRAAIRFVNLIEIVYSKHFLFHAGLNMIAMSVTGVGAVTKSNDLSELLRLIAVSCALLFHLCFECINAQRLIDYSGYLHTNLINLNWYNASPRTKKLVLFMMMKTQPPCVLTAGGMFVLCMETFATVRFVPNL
ncbi:OR59B protein, partial [Acromyrmex heyeri]